MKCPYSDVDVNGYCYACGAYRDADAAIEALFSELYEAVNDRFRPELSRRNTPTLDRPELSAETHSRPKLDLYPFRPTGGMA